MTVINNINNLVSDSVISASSSQLSRSHSITSKSLKLITFNISKSFKNVDYLAAELSKPNSNILLCLNETSYLSNFENYGLYGVRLDNKDDKTSGLCLYISNHLREFTEVNYGRFSIYGQVNFPASSSSDGCSIGFCATYRNPALNNTIKNDEYFEEITMIMNKIFAVTDLAYLLGDLNLYNKRYDSVDFRTLVDVSQYSAAVKSYNKLLECFTGKFASLYTGVTHVPRSPCSKDKDTTAAQLDYIFCQYPGSRYPKGKCKVILGAETCDHFCLVAVINLPKFVPKKIEFETSFKLFEPDYGLVNDTLTHILVNNPISSDKADLDFLSIEATRLQLLEATGTTRKRSIPNKLTNPYLIKACILQDRADKARVRGDIRSFKEFEDKIRVVISEFLVDRASKVSVDKSSSDFHKYAGALLKPVKASIGKYTMRDCPSSEIAKEISTDYINPNADLSWRGRRNFTDDDKTEITNALNDFDFRGTVADSVKTPLGFKQLAEYHSLVSYQLSRSIVVSGNYVNSLKISKCTLLPSRSIFSAVYPESKIVEKFFLTLLQPEVNKTHNQTYRNKFSCTGMLLNQFHKLSIEPRVYAYNADIRKAFNTMSRTSILNAVRNPFLANILGSWMCRKDALFCMTWGSSTESFDRSDWTTGIEPGSNLGPVNFLLGLCCYSHMYLRAIQKQKNLFADDGNPLYKSTDVLIQDARDYYKHVTSLGMRLHTEGDKAMSYLAIGEVDENLGDLKFSVDSKDILVKRTFEVRQLGLYYGATKGGKLKILIDNYIDRIKPVVAQLRAVSDLLPTSVLNIMIRSYCVSIIGYNIAIYLPILWYQKDKQLDSLRYWNTCLKAISTAGCLDVMKGSNVSKTLQTGTRTEKVLSELSGLETLEELYFMSCCSHYPQLLNLRDFDMLDDSVSLNVRTGKLMVRKASLKGRISPISTLVDSVNLIKDGGLKSAKVFMKGNCFLKSVENDFKNVNSRSVRALQRAISLDICGKLDDPRTRTKFSSEQFQFIN